MQTSIDDFFPKYRLYIYKDKISHKPCIPPKFFKIQFPKFSLVCYVGIDNDQPHPKKKTEDKIRTACYKSLLQKAVRRFNLEEGLRAFDWLWENDQKNLLRRLPIISVEDGFYNPADNCLWMWLYLISTQGLEFPEGMKNLCRESVTRLILHPGFSKMYEVRVGNPLREFSPKTLVDKPELLPLLLRYPYGGNTGDMMMIHRFVQYYEKREMIHSLPLENPTSGPLFQACDFHIFPRLAPTREFRNLVWKHRSGINLRSLKNESGGETEELETYDRNTEKLYRNYLLP